jgi:hypothetical protein
MRPRSSVCSAYELSSVFPRLVPVPNAYDGMWVGELGDCQRVAVAEGIPDREHSLFPPDDPVLKSLATQRGLKPFQKLLIGASGNFEVVLGSWAVRTQPLCSPSLRLYTRTRAKLSSRACFADGLFFCRHASLGRCVKPESSRCRGGGECSPRASHRGHIKHSSQLRCQNHSVSIHPAPYDHMDGPGPARLPRKRNKLCANQHHRLCSPCGVKRR